MLFHWHQWKWQTHFALLQEISLLSLASFCQSRAELVINDNSPFTDKWIDILDFDWLWSTVAMVVVIEWQVVIDDKFYEMGPRSWILYLLSKLHGSPCQRLSSQTATQPSSDFPGCAEVLGVSPHRRYQSTDSGWSHHRTPTERHQNNLSILRNCDYIFGQLFNSWQKPNTTWHAINGQTVSP